MRNFHLSLLFSIGCFVVYAQDSLDLDTERWYEGYLVTTNGDTLRGELSYNMVTNMVKVRQRDQMRVFSSFQTFHYKLYDEVDRRWRRFFSIPYSLKNDHPTPVLFELLSEGKLSLLARERWKNTLKNDHLQRSRYLKKDYFFIDRLGAIEYTQGRRGHLLHLMSDHEDNLRRYIRTNFIDLNQERSLQMVTTYYNKLVFDEELRNEKEPEHIQSSPASDLILGANNEGTHIWTRTDL